MATNITKEENLVKVHRNTITRRYNENRTEDLLSETKENLVVVFKDKDGEYPSGKIVVSDEIVTRYNYEYFYDELGNVTSCIVTKTVHRNGQSTDISKTSSKTYFDERGRKVKVEYYTYDGIMFNREQYWYWDNNKIKTKTIKSTDVITTYEYNVRGDVTLIWSKTLKSKAVNKKYTASYNIAGEMIHYTSYEKGYECFIENDKDHNGNTLSTTNIYKHINGKRNIFARTTRTYNPDANFKISKVIKNGFIREQYWYDLEGELIKMLIKDNDAEVMTRIERKTDIETGELTVEKHIYIEDKCGKQHSKYIKEVYDSNNNLLLYAEDNSKVTTYTYNVDNKRETAITKQLIGEEFVMIDKITYEYTESESGTVVTRTEERYDKDGNTTSKNIRTESLSDIEQEFINETKFYEIPDEVIVP